MSGNAISDSTPIEIGDVPEVISLITNALPEEILINLQTQIGSAGFREQSGDIDLMIDSEDVVEYFQTQDMPDSVLAAKKALVGYLEKRNFKSVLKGRNVHVGVPYEDNLAQVDLMIVDEADIVAPWHQHGPRGMYSDEKFKGSSVFVLISSIAKHMGLKFDPFAAKLIDRTTNEVVGRSRRQVSKILLGPKAKEKDLDSVSNMMTRLADDPDREGKLVQARQDAQKGLLELPEDVLPGTATWLSNLEESTAKFSFVKSLKENVTSRTPHPEDSIFDGSNAAADAVKSLGGVIANPSNITIKWDGFPALIFGRTPEGTLAIMDKYMFDKNILATSPDDWQDYDRNKPTGTLRPDLYIKLATIWAGLDAATSGPGFFWGDLLWAGQLNPIKGQYAFKPNTVEYQVPVQSSIGQSIKGRTGGIVVHQHFDEFGGQPHAWDGSGLNSVPGGATIIKPGLGIRFTLRDPVQLSRAANAAVQQYGQLVDDLFLTIPASTRSSIKTYFNKKITSQTDQQLHDWMRDNVSSKQYNALVGDDYSGSLFVKDGSGTPVESPGYTGLKAIWNSIYAYKLNLVQQLEAQVQGVQQFVNGQPGGEGFVFPTPTGLLKLVNRGQFSRALFNSK